MTTEHDAQQSEAAEIIEWLQPADLSIVQTPEQGEQVTALSAAAIAYYREQRDYENVMKAWRLYVAARRKTTELCLSEWQGNTDVTLSEMGFTKMQWHRRTREYQIPDEKVNEYFDECIAKGWQPSIAGLLRVGGEGQETDEMQRHIVQMTSAARWLFTPERMRSLTRAQKAAVGAVLDAFE